MNTQVSLQGKTALITGATGGIGKAITVRLAQKGMRLILIGKTTEKLSVLKKELEKIAVATYIYEVDLSKQEDLLKQLAVIGKKHTIDVLIHCAGVIKSSFVEESTIDDFEYQHKVNLGAPVIMTIKLLPVIIKAKGQIVFINSSVVNHPKAGTSFYAAAKAGLKAFADGLRAEVNKQGIRVISIFPGTTATSLQKNLTKQLKKKYSAKLLLQPEDIAEITVTALEIPLTAEVTDVFVRPFHK